MGATGQRGTKSEGQKGTRSEGDQTTTHEKGRRGNSAARGVKHPPSTKSTGAALLMGDANADGNCNTPRRGVSTTARQGSKAGPRARTLNSITTSRPLAAAAAASCSSASWRTARTHTSPSPPAVTRNRSSNDVTAAATAPCSPSCTPARANHPSDDTGRTHAAEKRYHNHDRNHHHNKCQQQ
jgi:hypothetical protein